MGALIAIREGGPGSGDPGHAGRKGQVGGSAKMDLNKMWDMAQRDYAAGQAKKDNSFGSQDNVHSYEPKQKFADVPDPKTATDDELVKWAAKDQGALKLRNGTYAIKGAHHWLVMTEPQLVMKAAGELVAPQRMPSKWSPFPSTPKESVQIERRIVILHEGGPGSGNIGHAGRPGMVGGSAAGSGGSRDRWGVVRPSQRVLGTRTAISIAQKVPMSQLKAPQRRLLMNPPQINARDRRKLGMAAAPRAARGEAIPHGGRGQAAAPVAVDAPPAVTGQLGRSSPVETTLQNSSVVKDVPMDGGGISETWKITLQDGTQAVFKPDSGEGGLESDDPARSNITLGYSSQREVGAWEMAQIVGMDDMVQPAAFRTIKGEPGSLELWVTNGKIAADATNKYDGYEQSARAAAFDFVIGNEDRHAGNWMVTPDNRLHLIDHNLAFPDSGPYGRGFGNHRLVDHMQGVNVPEQYSPHSLAAPYMASKAEIRTTLAAVGLPSGSIDGVIRRIGQLNKAKDWSALYR